jgi:hypothetical protein
MEMNLVEYYQTMFTNRAVHKMANFVGERKDKVHAALTSFFSIIVGELADKASEMEDDAKYIRNVSLLANINRWKYRSRHLPVQWEQLEKSELFLNYLFGEANAWRAIAEHIADRYNIRVFSATVIMEILTPICLSNLGRNILEYDLSPAQMRSFLIAQQKAFYVFLNEGRYSAETNGKEEEIPAHIPSKHVQWKERNFLRDLS